MSSLQYNNYLLYKKGWISYCAPHVNNILDSSQCKELLKIGGYFVRQTSDYDCQKATPFWYLIKDHFEGLGGLSAKTARQIRHALDQCDIRIVPRQRLLSEDGYQVTVSAYSHYKTQCSVPTREQYWEEMTSYGPECEFWGAFDRVSGALVALSVCRIWDGCCFFETSRANYHYRQKHHVMYGLYHRRNEHYLSERGFKYVLTSARSITEHSNIQEFMKQRFNFREAYCHMHIYYTWWLRLVVNITYPFRNLVPIPRLRALLRQEEMARAYH